MSIKKTTKKVAKFTWDINPYVIARKKVHKAVAKGKQDEHDDGKYDPKLIAFMSAVVHEFSTSGEKTKGQRIYILNDGSIKIGTITFKKKYKPAYELSNEQVAKIETSSSQAGVTTENSIKVTAADGRIDVFRPINFGPTFDRSMREASKLPAILSAIYGERYSRL